MIVSPHKSTENGVQPFYIEIYKEGFRKTDGNNKK